MLQNLMVAVFIASVSTISVAQEIQVIDVRRNITLAEDELPYKDFYINAGQGSGLKKNLVVQAVRKFNVRDASGAQSYGEITIPVGQLKVIAVYGKVSVAREYKLLSRDELPMLEQIGIMAGDKIEIKGSFVDNSPLKRKPQAIEESPTEPATPIAPAAAVSTSAPSTIASPPAVAPTPSPAAPAGQTVSAPPETLEKTASSGNKTEL